MQIHRVAAIAAAGIAVALVAVFWSRERERPATSPRDFEREILAQPGPPGDALIAKTLELRANGELEASKELATRTVAWYSHRPPDETAREATRYGLARALYVAERWDGALELFRALVRDVPGNVDYLGYLGAVQARRGDRGEALRVSAALRESGRAAPSGTNTHWCARIASLLGDQPGAVDLLREALAQGVSSSVDIGREMDFEALRGYAPFEELAKSKG